MFAALIGTIGVLLGATLFALGIADESAGNHVLVLLGVALIVLSLLLPLRGRGSEYHAE